MNSQTKAGLADPPERTATEVRRRRLTDAVTGPTGSATFDVVPAHPLPRRLQLGLHIFDLLSQTLPSSPTQRRLRLEIRTEAHIARDPHLQRHDAFDCRVEPNRALARP